ncbi:MAG TPA: hypothetical protein VMV99_01560 [Rhodanobacter sp.]|nr:hypothetical protein [Rhodanobacter sp.]
MFKWLAYWFFDTKHLTYETDEAKAKWSLLRAIEWGIWPLFVSQPIIPVMLIYIDWVIVISSLFIISTIWQIICLNLVNLTLSEFGCRFVKLKWYVSISVAFYLIVLKHYELAALAGLWPLAVLILNIFFPSRLIGVLQAAIVNKMMALEESVKKTA